MIAALKASRGQQADKGAKRNIAINPRNIAINLGFIAIFVSAAAVIIHDAHGRWRVTGNYRRPMFFVQNVIGTS